MTLWIGTILGMFAAAVSTLASAHEGPPAPIGAGEILRDCAQCPEMVAVPAGEFTMGAVPGPAGHEKDEGPPRRVRIESPFAMGRFEVSVREWNFCVAENACTRLKNEGSQVEDDWPAANMTYHAINDFIAWLGAKTGMHYRLPSEAEWEYAARAETLSGPPGRSATWRLCRSANVADRAARKAHPGWAVHDCDDGFGGPAPVGSFDANAFGLHDLLGNVWEWVADCWNASYDGAPEYGRTWDRGDCTRRVVRGGAWNSGPGAVRVTNRARYTQDYRSDNIGFRVVRPLVAADR